MLLAELVLEHKHASMPSISPRQPSSMPSSHTKGNLPTGMRLVELNTPRDIECRGRKLPDGAVELLWRETSRLHGVQELAPRDLTREAVFRRGEEESREDLFGALVDDKSALLVRLFVWGCCHWCCDWC